MEHQLWKSIVVILSSLCKKPSDPKFLYSDERIVRIYYWAVAHDRPICWALDIKNWPIHLRKYRMRKGKRRPDLPDGSVMSRRLKSPSVRTLLDELEKRVVPPQHPGLFWAIDGKPLVISNVSKDRQAGYGRAGRGMAKGYKIHAIVGADGIYDWRIAPMNVDERTMAARMLKKADIQGYLLGDKNYDSNPLHDVCLRMSELRFITPRRSGKGCGLGKHRHSEGRLRSIERTENPFPDFADQLLQDRNFIERHYGNLTNWGGGLTSLPSWVRGYNRVRRWVQAKLVLDKIKRHPELTTYVA